MAPLIRASGHAHGDDAGDVELAGENVIAHLHGILKTLSIVEAEYLELFQ